MENSSIKQALLEIKSQIRVSSIGLALFGSAILAFGLYQIHSFSGITEGGVLGLTLLLHHWLNLSPAISGFLLNALCYLVGFRALGKMFIVYSAVSGIGFSLFYGIFERFPRFWAIGTSPQSLLIAGIVGALFVGFGAGLCVRVGGAPCGDDAVAMAIAAKSKISIQWAYLISDLTVIGLSLTYIPIEKLIYSLITVVISGQIIGLVSRVGRSK